MTVGFIVRHLWRWVVLTLVLAVAGGVAAYIGTRAIAPTYDAQATVLVGPMLSSTAFDYNDVLVSQALAQMYSDLATSDKVIDAAAGRVTPKADPASLARATTARAPVNSSFVEIDVTDGSASRASNLANAVAAALIDLAPKSSGDAASLSSAVRASIDGIAKDLAASEQEASAIQGNAARTAADEQRLQFLEGQIATLRSEQASLLTQLPAAPVNNIVVTEAATPPASPASPSLPVNLGLGILAGLAIGVALTLLFGPRTAVPTGAPVVVEEPERIVERRPAAAWASGSRKRPR